jgi:hypothetical protein
LILVTGDLADEGSLVTPMEGIYLDAGQARQMTYVDVPDEGVRQALLGAGLNQWFASALVGLYQDYRRSGTDGYAAQVTSTVERITGRPARSLDDLLGEIAPSLQGNWS